MLFKCPICQNELIEMEGSVFGDADYYCGVCRQKIAPEIYEDVKVCPECSEELDVIVGCGVDDYYCERCGKTILKENIKMEYRRL